MLDVTVLRGWQINLHLEKLPTEHYIETKFFKRWFFKDLLGLWKWVEVIPE